LEQGATKLGRVFYAQAEIAKLRSNCITRQIGSVIVKDNRQIATGYNGIPLESRIVSMVAVVDVNQE
jgi:deoxycytidylate deaminase